MTQCRTNSEWAARMNASRQALPDPIKIEIGSSVWTFTPVWVECPDGIEQRLDVARNGEQFRCHGLWEFYRVASKVLAQTPRG